VCCRQRERSLPLKGPLKSSSGIEYIYRSVACTVRPCYQTVSTKSKSDSCRADTGRTRVMHPPPTCSVQPSAAFPHIHNVHVQLLEARLTVRYANVFSFLGGGFSPEPSTRIQLGATHQISIIPADNFWVRPSTRATRN